MTFTIGIDIAAPPDRVFAFVSDFSTVPQWYSAVRRVTRTTGDGGPGTHYEVLRELPGGPAVNDVEVTAYANGEVVTFTSVSGPTPFEYRYRVDSIPAGTRLTLEGTISASGLPGLAGHLGPIAEQLFKRGMKDNLATLARIIVH